MASSKVIKISWLSWSHVIGIVIAIMAMFFLVREIIRKYFTKSKARLAKSRFDEKILDSVQQQAQFLKKKKSPLETRSTEDLRRTVRILHDGVPDRYTSYGQIIPGIAADPNTARFLYDELLKRGDITVAEPYARLLEFGVAGREDIKDRQKAVHLYKMHYDHLTDPYERYDALDAIERLSDNALFISALKSQVFDDIAETKRVGLNLAAKMKLNQPKTTENPYSIRTTNEDIWMLPPDAFRAPDVQQNDTTATLQPIRADAHNSHDSGVTRTVKASVDRLRNIVKYPEISPEVATKQIRDMITDSTASEDRKRNAITALDTIERNNQYMTVADTTEVDLLGLVWNRVHQPENADNRQALRDNLLDELSECIEHNKPTCATGRFNRIIGTLNGVDDIVDIKPTWAISREMIDKAGVIYKNKVESLNDREQKALESIDPSDEQRQIAEEKMGGIKDDIRADFKSNYVDTGIMTDEKLDVEMSKWIDHIG